MKPGRSLTALAEELERQKETKKDYVADTTLVSMQPSWEKPRTPQMVIRNVGTFGIKDTAHEQLASKLRIPKAYYDRMREQAPELLAQNVNQWLHEEPEKRMLRTLDGDIRAFLSNRYRPLDHYDLMEAVLPQIAQSECNVESCELTERRLYVKAISEKISGEVAVGDVVQAGIVVSNSEVGLGSVKVEPLLFRLQCLNGMIIADSSLKKYHLGRGFGEGEDAAEFYRDATREADDRAFFMKVRDVVEGTLSGARFHLLLNRLKDATHMEIEGSIEGAVEEVSKRYSFTENEKEGVLKHLIKGGDLTQYGMLNAISRASQDVDDYDRGTELERNSGEVLLLPSHEWEEIVTA